MSAVVIMSEIPMTRSEPSIRLIAECSATRYGVSYTDLISSRRHPKYVLARQMTCFLARRHTTHSLPAIGRRLGGRDHTTVLHSINRLQSLIDTGHTEIVSAVTEIETAIGCGTVAIERTGSIIFTDTDVHAAAARILDVEATRVSTDEVRAMASFIRAHCAPIVDYSEPTPVTLPPQPRPSWTDHVPAPDGLRVVAEDAVQAWAKFQSFEFSGGEKAARATFTKAMQALAAAIKGD
jgi:hypothetical protein